MNPNENTEPAAEKSLADRESEATLDVFAERIRKAEAELKRLGHEEDKKWKRYEIALLRSREALYRVLAIEDESAGDDGERDGRLTEAEASAWKAVAESDQAAEALGLSDEEKTAKRDLIEDEVEDAVIKRLVETSRRTRNAASRSVEAPPETGFRDRVRSFASDRNRMRELESRRDEVAAAGEPFRESNELRKLYGTVEKEGKLLEEEYRRHDLEGAFHTWLKKGADEKKIPMPGSGKRRNGKKSESVSKSDDGSGEPASLGDESEVDTPAPAIVRSAEFSDAESPSPDTDPSRADLPSAHERLRRISAERIAVEEALAEVRSHWNDSIRRLHDAGLYQVTGDTFRKKQEEEEREHLERIKELDAEEAELKAGLDGQRRPEAPVKDSPEAAMEDSGSGGKEPIAPVASVIAPVMTERPEGVSDGKDRESDEADALMTAPAEAAPSEKKPEGESGILGRWIRNMEEPEPSEKEPEKSTDRNPESRSTEETAREEKAVKEALRVFTSYGLNADRLLGIEGYATLSGGERLLLAENFRQVARERGEEKAKDRVDASHTAASGNGVVRDLFAKIRALMPRDDNMRMAKARQAVDREEDWKENGEILSGLLRSMTAAEFRPRVDLDRDGKIDGVRFLSDAEYASFGGDARRSEAALRDFNAAARAFSRMPYEWSLGEAKKSEHRRYRDAEEKYLEARGKLVSASSGESPGLVGALARADRDVELMRMFSSDPDTENVIGRISDYADRSKALSFLKTNVFEKGSYYTFGFLKPMLAAGTFGFVAVPAISAGLGALRAYGRGRNELREAGKAGRRGAERGDRRQALAEEYGTLRDNANRSAKEEKRFRKLSVLFGDGFDGRFGAEFAELSAKRERWVGKNGLAPWTGKEARRYAMLESWKRDEEEYAQLDGERKRWNEVNAGAPWTGEAADRFRELSLDRRTGYGSSHPERRKEVVAAYSEVFGTAKTYVRAGDRHDPTHPSDGRYVKHGLSSKLARLTKEAADADEDGREEAVGRLRARIAYVRKRLDDGMIDFGGADARTRNRTDLILALSGAEATVAALGEDAAGTELEERLDAFLTFDDRKRDAAERAFMRKRMRDGAIVSATFGIAGSMTRHFAEVWQGESELLPKFLSGEKTAETGGIGEGVPRAGSAPVAPPETVPAGSAAEAIRETGVAIPESFVVEAKSGEGLTNLARHATDRYLEANPDPDLTAEHRIYMEDYLRHHSGFSGTLHPEDSVEFSRAAIEDAIREAKALDPAGLENLSPYADRVSSFENLPRFRAIPDAEVPESAVEETVRPSAAPSAVPVEGAVPAPGPVPSAEAIRTPAIRAYVAAEEGRGFIYSRNMAAMRESVFGNFDSATHGDVKAERYLARLAERSDAFSELPASDRAFARIVAASYGELRGAVALSDAEAERVLLPGKNEAVDAYFERIAFILVKKGMSMDDLMKTAETASDDDVVQFFEEKGLLGGK